MFQGMDKQTTTKTRKLNTPEENILKSEQKNKKTIPSTEGCISSVFGTKTLITLVLI